MKYNILSIFKKSKRIDYRDIIGLKTDLNNPSYGKGEKAILGFEKTIKEQLENSVIYGLEGGLARLCRLAASGKSRKAIREIKKLTKQVTHFNDCNFKCHEGYGENWTGNYDFILNYIDACLYGGKLAELNHDYEDAKLLYGRAKELIDDGENWTANIFNRQCNETNEFWKKAMKRMYKAGGLQ
ncbi:MAG: hypothetical protein WC438_03495 [Candidatus Pacearchaeota archaeon]